MIAIEIFLDGRYINAKLPLQPKKLYTHSKTEFEANGDEWADIIANQANDAGLYRFLVSQNKAAKEKLTTQDVEAYVAQGVKQLVLRK